MAVRKDYEIRLSLDLEMEEKLQGSVSAEQL